VDYGCAPRPEQALDDKNGDGERQRDLERAGQQVGQHLAPGSQRKDREQKDQVWSPWAGQGQPCHEAKANHRQHRQRMQAVQATRPRGVQAERVCHQLSFTTRSTSITGDRSVQCGDLQLLGQVLGVREPHTQPQREREDDQKHDQEGR